TNDPLFPTAHALFPTLRADDGFVTKLGANGQVAFSTFLGGSGRDSVSDVALDGAGNIYVVGSTVSTDLPVPGGLQRSLRLGSDGLPTTDGFLLKLANDGTAVLYGTYLGGNGSDLLNGVAVDGQGRVYLAGTTASSDLPVVRAFDPTLPAQG